MLSESSKEELTSIIERLKEEVVNLHTYIEYNKSINDDTYDILNRKLDNILIIINHLENQIYFS